MFDKSSCLPDLSRFTRFQTSHVQLHINLQMSFNTTAGRPMARAFHRVDLPGGGGEGGSHCPGVISRQI